VAAKQNTRRIPGKCQDYTEAAAQRQIMDIKQVAKRAKVSTATVSRVLNGGVETKASPLVSSTCHMWIVGSINSLLA
jgi:hypothetical protein